MPNKQIINPSHNTPTPTTTTTITSPHHKIQHHRHPNRVWFGHKTHQSKFILFTCNNIDFLQSDPHSCKPNNKLLLLAMNSVGEDVTRCQTAHERLQRIFWCSKIIVSDEVEVWFFWRSKRSDVMLPVLGGLRYLGKNKWLWDYAGLNIRPFFGFWTLRLFFPLLILAFSMSTSQHIYHLFLLP